MVDGLNIGGRFFLGQMNLFTGVKVSRGSKSPDCPGDLLIFGNVSQISLIFVLIFGSFS